MSSLSMKHETTEYGIAKGLAKQYGRKLPPPQAYALCGGQHEIAALSIDGAVRLAAQVQVQYQATITNFGSYGGCYTQSEQEALAEYRKSYNRRQSRHLLCLN